MFPSSGIGQDSPGGSVGFHMPDLSGSRSDPVGTPRLTGMESLAGVMASRPGAYLASEIYAEALTDGHSSRASRV